MQHTLNGKSQSTFGVAILLGSIALGHCLSEVIESGNYALLRVQALLGHIQSSARPEIITG